MITSITIKNFKSLENVTLDCSSLNVLTGLNGMGKSSVIQALLALRQSYDRGYLVHDGLSLNGDLVTIGSGKEALYEFAEQDIISFALTFKHKDSSVEEVWPFAYETIGTEEDSGGLKFMDSDYLPYAEDYAGVKNSLHEYNFFKRDSFRYLNADRWVKNEYDVSDYHVVRQRSLGVHGEYTTHFLEQFGSMSINPKLLFSESDPNELLTQVSIWLSEISPGTKVVAERIQGVNSVKLRYVFEDNGVSSGQISPLNVGFGITYILPVLVALLSSREGDVIIIENPESHIHPRGQSIIGKLMTKVAETGVQIFVETHSDHVLNGIRIATKEGISKDITNLFYFYRGKNKSKIYSDFLTPVIDDKGGVNEWPEGFFDQTVKDLNTLFDI